MLSSVPLLIAYILITYDKISNKQKRYKSCIYIIGECYLDVFGVFCKMPLLRKLLHNIIFNIDQCKDSDLNILSNIFQIFQLLLPCELHTSRCIYCHLYFLQYTQEFL